MGKPETDMRSFTKHNVLNIYEQEIVISSNAPNIKVFERGCAIISQLKNSCRQSLESTIPERFTVYPISNTRLVYVPLCRIREYLKSCRSQSDVAKHKWN